MKVEGACNDKSGEFAETSPGLLRLSKALTRTLASNTALIMLLPGMAGAPDGMDLLDDFLFG